MTKPNGTRSSRRVLRTWRIEISCNSQSWKMDTSCPSFNPDFTPTRPFFPIGSHHNSGRHDQTVSADVLKSLVLSVVCGFCTRQSKSPYQGNFAALLQMWRHLRDHSVQSHSSSDLFWTNLHRWSSAPTAINDLTLPSDISLIFLDPIVEYSEPKLKVKQDCLGFRWTLIQINSIFATSNMIRLESFAPDLLQNFIEFCLCLNSG